MVTIYCIDMNYGVTFKGWRLSSDKEVIKDILSDLECNSLFIKKRSLSLFKDYINTEDIIVVKESPENLEGHYFYESGDIIYSEKIIIYEWNKQYPHTKKLDAEILKKYTRIDKEIFEGSNHEKITKKVYIKK